MGTGVRERHSVHVLFCGASFICVQDAQEHRIPFKMVSDRKQKANSKQ